MSIPCAVCNTLLERQPTEIERLFLKVFCSEKCTELWLAEEDRRKERQKNIQNDETENFVVHDLNCSYCRDLLKGFTPDEVRNHVKICKKNNARIFDDEKIVESKREDALDGTHASRCFVCATRCRTPQSIREQVLGKRFCCNLCEKEFLEARRKGIPWAMKGKDDEPFMTEGIKSMMADIFKGETTAQTKTLDNENGSKLVSCSICHAPMNASQNKGSTGMAEAFCSAVCMQTWWSAGSRRSTNDTANTPKEPAHSAALSDAQCIDAVERKSYNVGSAIKYLSRCGDEASLVSLRKAKWHVDREIARQERQP